MLIIFIQSSFPAPEFFPPVLLSADKLIHILVFGLLALLCYISLVHLRSVKVFSLKPLLWTIIFCSFYAATDEFHQSFVINRSSEFADWLADFTGIILACILIRYFLIKRFDLFRPLSLKHQLTV
ncbi:MAG: VanZ family protein [Ignavibacteria bacterium]|nr:VanZ family protein [Ignavibacteria bacterium]